MSYVPVLLTGRGYVALVGNSGVRPSHASAQVVWAVRAGTEGGLNQKFERCVVCPFPRYDRYRGGS